MSTRTRQFLVAATAASALIGGLTACSNPKTSADAVPSPVGKAVQVAKNDQVAALVPADIRKRGKLTAAINPDAAPLKFVDGNGRIDGLSPELLQAAAAVMGLRIDLQKVASDSLVTGLESKRFDVIASYGDFKERRAETDFIDWLRGAAAILTSASFGKDKINPSADLCGFTMSYVRANAQQALVTGASKECVKNGKKPIDAAPYGDANAGLLSVASGQADAFWGDAAPMAYYVKENPKKFKIVYESSSAFYGIGINRANAGFTKALRAALLKLAADGVYDRLLKRWGQQGYGLPKFPLNTGGSINAL
jgi:polar amino acid transport system substrate-binding protein